MKKIFFCRFIDIHFYSVNILAVIVSVIFSVGLTACRTIVPPPPPPAITQQTPHNFRPLTFSLLKEIEKQAARDGKTIEDIKFYLSNDVKLVRADNGTTLEIDTNTESQYGVVYRSRLQNSETIIIPKTVSGFFIDEDPNRTSINGKIILGISFDPSDTNLLHFRQNGIDGDDYFYLDTAGLGSNAMVTYGGNNYRAVSSNGNEMPYLMIQFIDRSVNQDDNVRRLPGREIKPQIGRE